MFGPGRDLGTELLQSVREMTKGAKGRVHRPKLLDVARARLAAELCQTDFARLLGVSVRTVQDREQGRRDPSGTARTLIKVAERDPGVLTELAA